MKNGLSRFDSCEASVKMTAIRIRTQASNVRVHRAVALARRWRQVLENGGRNDPMKTHEFIKAVRNLADKELIFANADGQAIHAGYHLTEIKVASFETVDCGGKTNRWNETILQLWVPEDAEDTYMKSDKFLRIYDKVRRLVPVDEEAEIPD
jgi:hypothetical protein